MEREIMTSLVSALYQVKYNPFKYGEHLASFYSTLNNVENNMLLSQLVVPLCSHYIYQPKIENAIFGESRKSTIWSIFSGSDHLHDLQERVDDFKELTDQCLQYCLVNDWVEILPDELSIVVTNDSHAKFEKQKSAEKLGKLFSDLSALEIYAFLGVKP